MAGQSLSTGAARALDYGKKGKPKQWEFTTNLSLNLGLSNPLMYLQIHPHLQDRVGVPSYGVSMRMHVHVPCFDYG